MVEFAFVGVILVMFAFGIIVFGFLLSFKQDVTRAAAEGARVGAVVAPPASQPPDMESDPRYQATLAATDDAVRGFDHECGVDGMQCLVTVHDCANPAITDPALYWTDTAQDCVTVRLEYDYAEFPLIIDPPLLSGALPDTVSSESVARVNQ
jgi:Flp pilus assembly protein TadG